MKRIILGFLLAPLSSALLQAIIVGKSSAILIISFFAYPFALCLGVPFFILFRELGWLKLWQITAHGATLGILLGMLFALNTGAAHFSLEFILLDLGFFGLHGLLVSFIFWLLALSNLRANKGIQPTHQVMRLSFNMGDCFLDNLRLSFVCRKRQGGIG